MATARTAGLVVAIAAASVYFAVGREWLLPKPPSPWPPVVGELYPDIVLLDHAGRKVAISDFRGKVVLIEPVGVPCAACQAWSGGHRVGGFGGVQPQENLPAFEEMISQYAGISVDHPDLVVVQILMFDLTATHAPSMEEAANWARHFGLDEESDNVHVLVGDARFTGRASYDLIPGFQVVDRDGVLVVDAAGHDAPSDVYREAMPRLGELVGQ